MEIVSIILELLVIFFAPALMVALVKKFRFLNAVGPIVLCYALGILLSFLLLIDLPGGAKIYDSGLSNTITSLIIPVAIPILLFSFDLKSVKKLAGKSALSFALICITVCIVSVSAFFISKDIFGAEDAASYSAMTVGLYTGGTPNLFAIGKAMGLDVNKINNANLADMIFGGIYMFILLSIGRPVYTRILDGKKGVINPNGVVYAEIPAEARNGNSESAEKNNKPEKNDSSVKDYTFDEVKGSGRKIMRLVLVGLLGVGCLLVAALICMLVSGDTNIGNLGNSALDAHKYDMLIIMLTVTTLGIALSFVKKIRETAGTYQLGMYMILVFSLALSMSIDLNQLVAGILPMILFVMCVQTSSVILHIILCKIFKIDSGTAVITSTGAVYGPAFVPPVANAMKNDSIILPGLLCGILGYAIGNYLGIGIGNLLLLFA